jgi:hypothetical protein
VGGEPAAYSTTYLPADLAGQLIGSVNTPPTASDPGAPAQAAVAGASPVSGASPATAAGLAAAAGPATAAGLATAAGPATAASPVIAAGPAAAPEGVVMAGAVAAPGTATTTGTATEAGTLATASTLPLSAAALPLTANQAALAPVGTPAALYVEMQLPPPSVARSLRLASGQPAAMVTVRFDDSQAGRPVALTVAALRPDLFRIVVTSVGGPSPADREGSFSGAWTRVLEGWEP